MLGIYMWKVLCHDMFETYTVECYINAISVFCKIVAFFGKYNVVRQIIADIWFFGSRISLGSFLGLGGGW